MPQAQPNLRVKAKKMFKASIGGAVPVMVNPGDVVEVDRFMAGMLINSEKAELTEEKLFINKDYKAPERTAPGSDTPLSLLTRAIENLTRIVQESMARPKGQGH